MTALGPVWSSQRTRAWLKSKGITARLPRVGERLLVSQPPVTDGPQTVVIERAADYDRAYIVRIVRNVELEGRLPA